MVSVNAAILWFRHDLRLADNAALHYAVVRGAMVYPLFIWSPEEEGEWAPGAASRYWLHHALAALDRDLRPLKSRLLIRPGPAISALTALAQETGAVTVLWNRRYEPHVVQRDTKLKSALSQNGIEALSFGGALLFEPSRTSNRSGKPYQVFTPFWRHCQRSYAPVAPLAAPSQLSTPKVWPHSPSLDSLALLPQKIWAEGIRRQWKFGEAGAREGLCAFLAHGVDGYPESRDRPDREGVSRLSPHLHFGSLTPGQVWWSIADRHSDAQGTTSDASSAFLRQIVWREFAHHLLFHFPATSNQPLRREFESFPWNDDSSALQCWQCGQTGYPFVDAGMRELWTTGWMHNRVRMVAASFLVKHLLVHWIHGARWFWDTLVDADLANNSMGWQWVSGCGADAAPYFRIFNPVSQGQRFDPDGIYVRKWVPELAALPTRDLHAPWQASAQTLREAGVKLGSTYPAPIIQHDAARRRALAAWKQLRESDG